ncbi:hypothetical protein K8O92_09445 [Nocardia asteroides]|nr:hypothetical protein K8O92_09445 [Nocardia asteroides]
MILSRPTIINYIYNGRISMRPSFDAAQVRPFGIRVHLGADILRPVAMDVDLSVETEIDNLYRRESILDKGLVLAPGEFALGATIESFMVDPELACRLDGRSTLARLGLMVHCTAETIDNNNSEHRAVVLELKNISAFTVKIPYGYGVGMLTFIQASEPVDPADEQTQYAGQLDVMGPNLKFPAPYFGGRGEVKSGPLVAPV